jgi:deoxyribonuclease V
MELNKLNPWDLPPAKAVQVQRELAQKVKGGKLPPLRTVLGLDVSYSRADGTFKGAAVLLLAGTMQPMGSWSRVGTTCFPYVPGLLSFREIPPLLPILEEVPAPDIIIVDGHGILHPRRFGLASHIGLITGIPTIGCAKKLLAGQCPKPGRHSGDISPIILGGRVTGFALRSREKCNPIFISPGHLLDPGEALEGVTLCLKGYRLPEPTRLADRLSKGKGSGVEN